MKWLIVHDFQLFIRNPLNYIWHSVFKRARKPMPRWKWALTILIVNATKNYWMKCKFAFDSNYFDLIYANFLFRKQCALLVLISSDRNYYTWMKNENVEVRFPEVKRITFYFYHFSKSTWLKRYNLLNVQEKFKFSVISYKVSFERNDFRNTGWVFTNCKNWFF